MKTSIVTGGAGFLGSHLVDALVARGDSVVVIDNLTTGRLANLERSISTGRVTFVYADAAVDTAGMKGLLASAGNPKIDTIYHLASAANANPRADSSQPAGAGAAFSLIDIAADARAPLVCALTADDDGDSAGERRPEYENGARSVDAAIASLIRSRGVDGRLVRFFSCYGPRMPGGDGQLVPSLIDDVSNQRPMSIRGTDTQTRALMYVRDAIALLLLVATRGVAVTSPVDIGSSDARSVLDIAKAVAAAANRPFIVTHSSQASTDIVTRQADLTFARQLGWTPRTPLEDGLRATYEWFTRESRLYV